MMNKGDDNVLSKPLRRKAGSGDRAHTNHPSMIDYIPQAKINQLIGPSMKSGSGSFIGTSKVVLGSQNKHTAHK